MSLKYLLMILIFSLGLGSLSIINFDEKIFRIILILCYGVQGGIFGCLSIVSFPRFYGRKHLGSINGVFMGLIVFSSALGPILFGLSESITNSYTLACLIFGLLNFILFIASLFTSNYHHKLLRPTQ